MSPAESVCCTASPAYMSVGTVDARGGRHVNTVPALDSSVKRVECLECDGAAHQDDNLTTRPTVTVRPPTSLPHLTRPRNPATPFVAPVSASERQHEPVLGNLIRYVRQPCLHLRADVGQDQASTAEPGPLLGQGPVAEHDPLRKLE